MQERRQDEARALYRERHLFLSTSFKPKSRLSDQTVLQTLTNWILSSQNVWKSEMSTTSNGHMERIDLFFTDSQYFEEAQGDASTPGPLIVGDRLHTVDSDAFLVSLSIHKKGATDEGGRARMDLQMFSLKRIFTSISWTCTSTPSWMNILHPCYLLHHSVATYLIFFTRGTSEPTQQLSGN